jgi:hypothetical protein
MVKAMPRPFIEVLGGADIARGRKSREEKPKRKVKALKGGVERMTLLPCTIK